MDSETQKHNPRRIKRFVAHLSTASTKHETKLKKKADVRGQIEKLKSLSLNKRTKKADLENAFGDFEQEIHEVIMDEQKILEEQRLETKEIQLLKSMIEELSKKLVQLGKEYAVEMDHKDKKIFELRDSLASVRMDGGMTRKDKIAAIEKKVKAKSQATTSSHVENLKSSLKSLEVTHRQLAKSGAHPKKDLDRLKKTIESHKKKLEKLN